ncbi:LINE-1 reverse transcriptase-like protein [Bienertia sinuspersici]
MIDASVKKLREVVRFIDSSDARLSAFDKSILDCGDRTSFRGKLVLDVTTGWNSTCNMIRRAHDAKETIDLFILHPSNAVKRMAKPMWEKFDKTTKCDVDSYLNLPFVVDHDGFDILEYWKAQSVSYPTLALMARDILAIPITFVASESAFSAGDFREFTAEVVQQWVDSWLKLGPIVVQKVSRRLFIFHCILEDDKRGLLHHATACFHASVVVFKDWQEDRALRDYKFEDSAIWVRVEGIPANVNQSKVALNILERVGVCIFLDKDNSEENPQRATRVRIWLDLRKPLIPGVFLGLENGNTKWVDIRYEGVFIFCKNCGKIGHKESHCRTPPLKAKEKIWEAISNLCNQDGEHLISMQNGPPLYTNKIRGLKGIPQNKTTTLDLRVSVQNFKQNKFNGNSDSSSSEEEEDDNDSMDTDQEDNLEQDIEEDPEEDDEGENEGTGAVSPRGKRQSDRHPDQDSLSSSSSQGPGDNPTKRRRRVWEGKLFREDFATTYKVSTPSLFKHMGSMINSKKRKNLSGPTKHIVPFKKRAMVREMEGNAIVRGLSQESNRQENDTELQTHSSSSSKLTSARKRKNGQLDQSRRKKSDPPKIKFKRARLDYGFDPNSAVQQAQPEQRSRPMTFQVFTRPNSNSIATWRVGPFGEVNPINFAFTPNLPTISSGSYLKDYMGLALLNALNAVKLTTFESMLMKDLGGFLTLYDYTWDQVDEVNEEDLIFTLLANVKLPPTRFFMPNQPLFDPFIPTRLLEPSIENLTSLGSPSNIDPFFEDNFYGMSTHVNTISSTCDELAKIFGPWNEENPLFNPDQTTSSVGSVWMNNVEAQPSTLLRTQSASSSADSSDVHSKAPPNSPSSSDSFWSASSDLPLDNLDKAWVAMTLLDDLNEPPVEGKEEPECSEGKKGTTGEKKGTKRSHGRSWGKQVSLFKKQKYRDWMPKGLLGASIRPKGEKKGQEKIAIPDLNLPACGEDTGEEGTAAGPTGKPLENKKGLKMWELLWLEEEDCEETPVEATPKAKEMVAAPKGPQVIDDLKVESFVTFMYGSPYLREREEIWSNVSMILNVYSGSHLIIGDLNQLESYKQKFGGRQKIPLGFWFRNWTINHNLSEIPFKGAKFTWTNNREGERLIQERLDRAYGNHEWRSSYPNAIVWNFPVFLSDHGPIALDTNPSAVKRKRPYRLEAWSYNKTEIKEITEKSGCSGVKGSKMFILQRRLEIIKVQCMKWCLNYKKAEDLNWSNISKKLEENINPQMKRSEDDQMKVRKSLEQQFKDKWLYWKQRAKSKWDDWGDKSTSFFFKSVKTRKVKNEIRAIKNENDQWRDQDQDIKEVFYKHFTDLLSPTEMEEVSSELRDSWLSQVEPISALQQQGLEIPFSMDEIRNAAFGMKPNKSPGPDGIPPGFIQTHWELLKDDTFQAATSFFNSGHLLKEMNQTHITLIPKGDSQEKASDFRPISLCNTSYKIISKCMVNRLKGIIRDIRGEFQNAFIPGRLMNDNCLLAHEFVNWVKHKKKGKLSAAVLKIDLSKAYDRIRWDFLEKVLEAYQFPQNWIKLIMQCVTTVQYSILINGEPTAPFSPKTGLRQGDPLSPYLFILCMDILSKGLVKLQERRAFEGLQISRGGPKVSHLFFADDALFFFKATEESCETLNTCLNSFCQISGEQINTSNAILSNSLKSPRKSSVYSLKSFSVVRTNEQINQLDFIVDRIQQKISSWKFSQISQTGRIIVINVILTTLASHIMGNMLIHKRIIKRINSIVMAFWWRGGGKKETKPIHWVKRTCLEKRKDEGGLGIRNLESFNIALCARQAWRIHNNPQLLVSRVIRNKYKASPIVLARQDSNLATSSWGMRSMVNSAAKLKDGIGTQIGNGKSTKIWSGKWVYGDNPKGKQQDPGTELTRLGEETTVDALIDTNGEWNWQVIDHNFNPQTCNLIKSMDPPTEATEDYLYWTGTKNGIYSVKTGYRVQNSGTTHRNTDTFWTHFWKRTPFEKWKLFIWKIMNKAIPTKDNLLKRKMEVSPTCTLCHSAPETIPHLFRDCEITKRIWRASPLGINCESNPGTHITDWIKNFLNLFFKEDGKDDRRCGEFIATLWAIWIKRNEACFNNAMVDQLDIMRKKEEEVDRWMRSKNRKQVKEQVGNKTRQETTWTSGLESQNSDLTCIVDGSWKLGPENQIKAAIGWVIQTEHHPVEKGGGKVAAITPLQAELKAFKKGLQQCKDKGQHIKILTDSQEIITSLANTDSSNFNCRKLFQEIRTLCLSFSSVKCFKVPRPCVKDAHDLAVSARDSTY